MVPPLPKNFQKTFASQDDCNVCALLKHYIGGGLLFCGHAYKLKTFHPRY